MSRFDSLVSPPLILLAGCVISLAVVLSSCETARPETPATSYSVQVADARVCAASEVYTRATADDWSQRAAIANAALNHFRQLGQVPDCGSAVAGILGQGINRIRWQAALDAVDAVQTGSYTLPQACARATTVIPLAAASQDTPPVDARVARAPCVINGLVFAEVR